MDMRRRLGVATANAHRTLYASACGQHPEMRPWHFQWLSERAVTSALRDALASVEGDVLDVGCGDAPYRPWMPHARRYVGADVTPGLAVDLLIVPNEPWPIPSDSFDVTLCTQVLEHVADLDLVIGELRRVTHPGGRVIVTVPFSYNEHGGPHDYRRLSRHGVPNALGEVAEITVQTSGGVGTLLGTTLLNWLEITTARRGEFALLRLILLPLWIVTGAVVNVVCAGLDHLDKTDQFYAQVIVDARL